MSRPGTPNQPPFDIIDNFFKPSAAAPPLPHDAAFHPQFNQPYDYTSQFQRSFSYPTPPMHQPVHNPATTSHNASARLMALLSVEPSPSPSLSLPPPLPMHSSPIRLPSSKLARGRRVGGDHVVYDVDVRLEDEVEPQLEVTPITKYSSVPQLVIGRQIAVNKTYICYGLNQGNVRVLNINTALRHLLHGHSQRVTDMSFFAEDVNLLASASADGRVYVWKITESSEDEESPEISVKTVMALQMMGEGEPVHPRVCWHCHKQEILVVGIGKQVLRIDTTKIGWSEDQSVEDPVKCHVDKLVGGVHFIGRHEGEVTDLSMCQWMTSYLVSASADGTIKIWDDCRAAPLVVLRPHDGLPVNLARFLTSPHRPDHINLITGGPLNQEVKIWALGSNEGWFLPTVTESWKCMQTLEFKSSSEPRAENAFFNQVAVLSQDGLLLIANAMKNAIYAMHFKWGPCPATTRIDYIAGFTVKMPILSFTSTSSMSSHGEHVVQIYCVQAQAIQQYDLDLIQCLPPPEKNGMIEMSDCSVSSYAMDPKLLKAFDAPISVPKSTLASSFENVSVFRYPIGSASHETASSRDVSSLVTELKSFSLAPTISGTDSGAQSLPIIPLMSGRVSDVRGPTNGNLQVHKSDALNPPIKFQHPTHLVTPYEILMSVSSCESTKAVGTKSEAEVNIQDVVVNKDGRNSEVEVKVVDQAGPPQNGIFTLSGEPQNLASENKNYLFSQASEHGSGALSSKAYIQNASQDDGASHVNRNNSVHDVFGMTPELAPCITVPQSCQPSVKHKKQNGKDSPELSASALSPNVTDSNDFLNEPGASSSASHRDVSFSHFQIMQMLNQVLSTQEEMHKQMMSMVAVPVTSEGKRLEAALGRNIEKAIKANNEALWARIQEENSKNDKLSRERTQQLTNLVTNVINKDVPTILEKIVKKEVAAVGQMVVRAITPGVEKAVTSAITESFQRGVGDKAMNQLEKSVNLKLDGTVARQIQAQFLTSGRQALQESLKSVMEVSLIPAFEKSCRTMFELVDATFQKGMVEHTVAVQREFESAHSQLAVALREAINSATSVTHTLSGELADGQRKLLTYMAANPGVVNPMLSSPVGSFHEKVDIPVDATKELSRLVSEHKYDEAFNGALYRNDVSLVSWLCSQVDLHKILSMIPLPLSQGVLLSLLQQLACDIKNDTSRKLSWMTEVAAAINPTDPIIAVHVRPITEQVYHILNNQTLLSMTGVDMSTIRLLTHVINSMLMTCSK